MTHWFHDGAVNYAWIYHYQTSHERAIDHLKSLIASEFSGDTKMIAYHADGGKNLRSRDTRDLLTANNTTFTWSPAYKQSMNVSAERLIGIIVLMQHAFYMSQLDHSCAENGRRPIQLYFTTYAQQPLSMVL